MTDPVRLTVFHILKQIFAENAYANELSRDRLDNSEFNARDRAFASAMLYGTLTYLPNIDFQIQKASNRKPEDLDIDVATVLRMGTWQLKFSYGVPTHAAVNESVNLIKAVGNAGAAGLVNAVLRRLSHTDISFPSRYLGPKLGLSTEIFGMFKKWFGDEEAERLAEALLKPAEGVTVRARSENYDALFKNADSVDGVIRRGDYFSHAFIISGTGLPPNKWPGYPDGAFFVQDEASMTVGHLMSEAAKRRFRDKSIRMLDACAGVGGKSLDRAMHGDNMSIDAIEPHHDRFRMLQENIARLNTKQIRPLHTDFFDYYGGDYDQVLLDVPCSGIGVIANKPEIKLSLSYESLQRFPDEQWKFLEHAAPKVKSGGQLWYSTCTLNPEENENLVKSFLDQHPEYRVLDLTSMLPENLVKDDPALLVSGANGYITLFPHRVGTDGFFVAGMEKK